MHISAGILPPTLAQGWKASIDSIRPPPTQLLIQYSFFCSITFHLHGLCSLLLLPLFPSSPRNLSLTPQLFSNADHQLSKSKRWPRSITAYTHCVDMCCIILKYFDTRGGETPPAMSSDSSILRPATFSSTWVTEKHGSDCESCTAKKEKIQYVSLSPPFVNFSSNFQVFFPFFLSLSFSFFSLSLIYERKSWRHAEHAFGRSERKLGKVNLNVRNLILFFGDRSVEHGLRRLMMVDSVYFEINYPASFATTRQRGFVLRGIKLCWNQFPSFHTTYTWKYDYRWSRVFHNLIIYIFTSSSVLVSLVSKRKIRAEE